MQRPAASGPAGFEDPIPPPPRPIEYADVDARGWWLSVLAGLALTAIGIWMVANPFRSVSVLALLVGISLIVSGIVEILARGGSEELGWPAWIAGGLLAAAGILVLAWPDITLWAVAVVVGASLIVAGLLGAVIAATHRDRPRWVAELALSALSFVVGLAVLTWPDATLVVLAVFMGARAIGIGLLAIAIGWQAHHLAS
jgi:uncharacterized membrane protein HdeD (DUF308 family)